MRRTRDVSSWLVLLVALAVPMAAQLRVVTTQPDLAELARRLGGDSVTVESLTDGSEDLHLIRTRPSLLVRLRKADAFIQLGLDAEHAWVPSLLVAARNEKLNPGQPGFVNASAGIEALGIPTVVGRQAGPDVHPRGNPHFNLDPEGYRTMARNVASGLTAISPKDKEAIVARLAAIEIEIDQKSKEWKARLDRCPRRTFIEGHDAWIYFAKRFDLEIVAKLEPKPGLSPTPGHLSDVISIGLERSVPIVVCRPRYRDVGEKVALAIGAEVAMLPLSSTSTGPTMGWFAFMEVVVTAFEQRLSRP